MFSLLISLNFDIYLLVFDFNKSSFVIISKYFNGDFLDEIKIGPSLNFSGKIKKLLECPLITNMEAFIFNEIGPIKSDLPGNCTHTK